MDLRFLLSILLIFQSGTEVFHIDLIKNLIILVNEVDRLLDNFIYNWNLRSSTDEEYDFIIVGSGSGGSVLANRLSEIKQWKILLLEVGNPETDIMRIPLAAPAFQNTEYDWQYLMERQEGVGEGLEDKLMAWPRGKALGGTSTINYMIYTRANPWDYNLWSRDGNKGWSYDEVLPYFMKSESCKVRNADYRYHNTTGYLSVEDAYQSPLVEAFLEGTTNLKLPYYDYNAPTFPLVADTIQATLLNGERHSVARAFLWPARKRKNLHILTNAFVTKVLIDPTSKTAYGVNYDRRGKSYTVRAKNEVILSAGTFHSPRLLMLAGIGPAHHLQELGIDVLLDLPVGLNLHDHLAFPGISYLINKDISLSPDTVVTTEAIGAFLKNGSGPLSCLGGVEGIAYIKTEVSTVIGDYPDVELLFIGGSLSSDLGLISRKGMRITDKVYNGLYKPINNIPNWSIFPVGVTPKSRGYLKLQSKNPYDPPLFYGNYFSDPNNEDIQTFIAAIRFIQRIAATEPFQKYNSTLNPNRNPGCEDLKFDSDEYWECCVRSIANTLHHQGGTAKMGPEGDPTAVVSDELKVHGIEGLRVVDGSIIPNPIVAHSNVPIIMIGEKAADIIKANYGVL